MQHSRLCSRELALHHWLRIWLNSLRGPRRCRKDLSEHLVHFFLWEVFFAWPSFGLRGRTVPQAKNRVNESCSAGCIDRTLLAVREGLKKPGPSSVSQHTPVQPSAQVLAQPRDPRIVQVPLLVENLAANRWKMNRSPAERLRGCSNTEQAPFFARM